MQPIQVPRLPDHVHLPIGVYKWTQGSVSKAWGELSKSDSALHVKLCAYEQPLIARTVTDDGPVWADSCLEFFVRPEQDPRYLNLEANPLGAMIIGLGPGREGRKSLLHLKPQMEVRVSIEPSEGFWSVSYKLGFELLQGIYGQAFGPRFSGNLYKCGGADDHYGMWREVGVETPDYHRPEFFGAFEL